MCAAGIETQKKKKKNRNPGLGKSDYVVARDIPGTEHLDNTGGTKQGGGGGHLTPFTEYDLQ